MPYQIVSDGQAVDLDNIQYLLSPQDLAAYDLVPRLIEIGVTSLKIEGRLKTAGVRRQHHAALSHRD